MRIAGADMGLPTGLPRSITLKWLLGFLLSLVALTWLLVWSAATNKVDLLLHDSWVRFSGAKPPSDIAIVGLDARSLETLGRWPWPRDLQAIMFEALAEHDIHAAVIDLLYVEPSQRAANDARLINAITALPITILPVLTEGLTGPMAEEKLPLPLLTRNITNLGHVHLPIDGDGIVRRIFLKSGYNQPHWPSLAVAAHEATRDAATPFVLPGKQQPELLSRPGDWVEDREVYVPFYGKSGTIDTISALDLIRGTVSDQSLRGKTVFVGMTSTGLNDVVPTPVSALAQPMPGVEVHANVLAALRDGRLVTELDPRYNMLLAFILLPLMLIVYSRARPQWGLACTILGAVLPLVISYVLYRFFSLWLAPLASAVPVLVSYLVWSWHRLEFVVRFLERENKKSQRDLSSRESSDDRLLAEFFEHAQMHLPIKGWKFEVSGEVHSGGELVAARKDILASANQPRWTKEGNTYYKRYATPGRLEISLKIPNADVADDITRYVDSLARIQSRYKPPRYAGSVERLQSAALKLGDQMSWLRGIKTFSETILAGSPAGFIVWNAAGEMVRSNQLLYQMLPELNEHALLADFVQAVGCEPAGKDQQRFEDLLLAGRSWQVPLTRGEQEFIVNLSAMGETLADRLICASIIDVSRIRGVERARAEMVDYLSHDLRSPLISALYMLEDDGIAVEGRTQSARERLDGAAINVRRSLEMMDDLLHIARADSLRSETFRELLFNDVVDNAIDVLAPQARSQRIKLDVDSDDDDMWMRGDAASLERAVINIVSNAIKYSPEDSRVTIRTFVENGEGMLEVSDQGVGIDPRMQAQLFTRFKRDESVAQQFQGIGLGLALVSRVVSQHGGVVQADSAPGAGTIVRMRLPLIHENQLSVDNATMIVPSAIDDATLHDEIHRTLLAPAGSDGVSDDVLVQAATQAAVPLIAPRTDGTTDVSLRRRHRGDQSANDPQAGPRKGPR